MVSANTVCSFKVQWQLRKIFAEFPILINFPYFAYPKLFKSVCSAPLGTDAHKSKLRRLLSPSCLQTCFHTAAQRDHRSVIQLHILFTHETALKQNPYFKRLHQKLRGARKEKKSLFLQPFRRQGAHHPSHP